MVAARADAAQNSVGSKAATAPAAMLFRLSRREKYTASGVALDSGISQPCLRLINMPVSPWDHCSCPTIRSQGVDGYTIGLSSCHTGRQGTLPDIPRSGHLKARSAGFVVFRQDSAAQKRWMR